MPGTNQNLIVVGGTSGIGLAVARGGHALGCNVAISGRGAERAAEIAKSIGADVSSLHLDLEDSASIRAALAEGPPIDHLVLTPIHRLYTNVKEFNVIEATRLARVKLIGYVETVTAALPRLKAGSCGCVGHHVAGTAIYYTPEKTFDGADEFSFSSRFPNGTVLSHQAIIDVK